MSGHFCGYFSGIFGYFFLFCTGFDLLFRYFEKSCNFYSKIDRIIIDLKFLLTFFQRSQIYAKNSFPEIPENFPTLEISYPIPEIFKSGNSRQTRTRLFQLREFPYPPVLDFFRTRHITSAEFNATFLLSAS